MSEFTHTLGNVNDTHNFMSDMEIALSLLQQAVPENNTWDELYRLWIDNSMHNFSTTIKNYEYLKIDGIEEIKEVIEKYNEERKKISDKLGMDIPEEIKGCIERLKTSVGNMLTKYKEEQDKKAQEERAEVWEKTLDSIITAAERLKQVKPDGHMSTIKQIAIALQKEVDPPEQSEPMH